MLAHFLQAMVEVGFKYRHLLINASWNADTWRIAATGFYGCSSFQMLCLSLTAV